MMNWNKYFEYREGNLYWKDISDMSGISHLSKGKWKVGSLVGSLDKSKRNNKIQAKNGYWRFQGTIDGIKYSLKIHRIIWEMFNGEIPNKIQIDHINGDGSDNRIENLRLATHSENMLNRNSIYKNKTSKYKGIYWRSSRKRWVASIDFNNKYHHIGSFINEEDARKAYLEYGKRVIGEFFRQEEGDISR